MYGDDFTVLGAEEQLDWFRKRIKQRYEVEFKARLGVEEQDDRSVFLLNRTIQWDANGISYEADQRHMEIILRDLGLREQTNTTPIPYIRQTVEQVESPGPELERRAATMYRAIVARGIYLSQDRSHIRYAVKELSRSMSQPTEGDLNRLKRLGNIQWDTLGWSSILVHNLELSFRGLGGHRLCRVSQNQAIN